MVGVVMTRLGDGRPVWVGAMVLRWTGGPVKMVVTGVNDGGVNVASVSMPGVTGQRLDPSALTLSVRHAPTMSHLAILCIERAAEPFIMVRHDGEWWVARQGESSVWFKPHDLWDALESGEMTSKPDWEER